MDLDGLNKIGSQQGLALQTRNEPNKEETIAVSVWNDNGYNSILYNPWCSNANAQVVHGHYHTSWARNIFYSYQNKLFEKPAVFDWKGKTVYIIGRGKSAKKNANMLNSVERKNPALFINQAYNGAELQKNDCVVIADNRILGTPSYKGAINSPLISFPGIDEDILGDSWRGVYGFVPWTKSPLNNFMRELFPNLPRILDILTVSVMATHLALYNGAKNIVFMGMDNTVNLKKHPQLIKTKDINGKPCKTVRTYYEMAIAVCQLAGFARFHTNARFFNATGAGILGVNYFDKCNLFPWIKQIPAWDAIRRFEQ